MNRQPAPMENLNISSLSICNSSLSTITCSVASSSRSISTREGATVNKPMSSLSCLGYSFDEGRLNSARWIGSPNPTTATAASTSIGLSNERPPLDEEDDDASITLQSLEKPVRTHEKAPPAARIEAPTKKPAWQLWEDFKKQQRSNDQGELRSSDHSGRRDSIPKMPTRSMHKEDVSDRDLGAVDVQEEVLSHQRKKLARRIEEIQQMLDSDTLHTVPSLFHVETTCHKISQSGSSSKRSSKTGALQESVWAPPRMPTREMLSMDTELLHEDFTVISNDSSHSNKSKTNKKSKTKSSSSTSSKKARRKKKSIERGGSSEAQHNEEGSPRFTKKKQREASTCSTASRSRSRSRSRSPQQSTPTMTLTVGVPSSRGPKSYLPKGTLKRHKSELRRRRDFIRNSLTSILEDDNENRSPIGNVDRRRKPIRISQSCPTLFISPNEFNGEYSSNRRDNMKEDDPERYLQNHGVGSRTLKVNR
jgi:hypothetical protein